MLEIGAGLSDVLVALITGVFGYLGAKLLNNKTGGKTPEAQASSQVSVIVDAFQQKIDGLNDQLAALEKRANALQDELDSEQVLRKEVEVKYSFALEGLRNYRENAPEIKVSLNRAVERDL